MRLRRRYTTAAEFFANDLEDPRIRAAFREILDEELGEILRYLREHKDVTQAELAKRLGYANHSRVAQIEGTEGLALRLETIARYANALGYRLDLAFVDRDNGELVARIPLVDTDQLEERGGWRGALTTDPGVARSWSALAEPSVAEPGDEYLSAA